VTGPGEPAPWVLPLVVRIERSAPPDRTDALEAAGRAVLAMLTDPRGWPGGPWADPLRSWQDGRIRKVVRRARGAGWRRAAALDGLPLAHRTARIRVYPPVPVDGWPADLARLQVGGTDLADPAPPPPTPPGTPVIWLAPELEMTAGKAMAQVGHAAQLGWWASPAAARAAWAGADFALAVRSAQPRRWTALLSAGAPAVRDAGFTEIAPGSCTAVADLPWLRGGQQSEA
jgi:peptidyl-tRNA hydrolase